MISILEVEKNLIFILGEIKENILTFIKFNFYL